MFKKLLAILVSISMLLIIFTGCSDPGLNVQIPDDIDTSSGSSKGLEFVLNEDGQSYTCVSVGSCTYATILIDMYNGLPVTAIGERAFYSSQNIVRVTLGDHIKEIGKSAFELCTTLAFVTFGKSVEVIGESAFDRCSNISSISLPQSLITIGDYAFWSCDGLKEIVIPKNVVSIGKAAFYDCNLLEDVLLGKSVEIIGAEAFKNCFFLTTITFADKEMALKTVENGAFDQCPTLYDIVYYGNLDEWTNLWDGIKIDKNNDTFKNITVTYA